MGNLIQFISIKKYFLSFLKSNQYFLTGDYLNALKETILHLDQLHLNYSIYKDIIAKVRENLTIQETENFKKEQLNEDDYKLIFNNSGSTFIGILIDTKANKVYVINIGDSQGLISKNEKIDKLCEIHDGLNETEKKRIENAGGRVIFEGERARTQLLSGGSFGMSRAIGDIHCKADNIVIGVPETYVYDIDDSLEFCFIGSDGCFERKSQDDIGNFIGKSLKDDLNNSESKIIESIFELGRFCEDQGRGDLGKDNMSGILINFNKLDKNILDRLVIREDRKTQDIEKLYKEKGETKKTLIKQLSEKKKR